MAAPVQLNYKQFGQGFPVIILHGLLGSLDNWQTIAKKLAEQFSVYVVDQRNHGKSAHTDEFNYDLLTADLLHFMQQHGLAKAHLIGHSMGGKTAMQFALKHPDKVAKLVVVDIAPAAYGDHHSEVFEALFAANVAEAISREQVQEVLRAKLGDETTVQFLMKGLHRNENANGYSWKFNATALWNNYDNISVALTGTAYTGPALFIKGSRSNYINSANYGHLAELFPDNRIEEIKDAGHWVHADNPTQFTEVVQAFLA